MHDAEIEKIRMSQEHMESILEKSKLFSEEVEAAAAEQEKRLKNIKLTLLIFALLGAIGAIFPIASQFVGLGKIKNGIPLIPVSLNSESFVDKQDFEALKASHERMKHLLVAFDKRMNDSSGSAEAVLMLSSLKSNLDQLDERLKTIERAISDSPEKALSIPMLRKDQDNLAKSIESNRLVVSAELTRINELQKWILGGIGTVLVAGIAALFTALFNVLSKGRSD